MLAEKVEQDEEREKDINTMKLVQAIGNNIHPSIQVEIDYPSRYDDKKMPTLDLKLWVTRGSNMCKIFHDEHYMIPMASIGALRFPICNGVEYQENCINTALRIKLNCGRELQW